LLLGRAEADPDEVRRQPVDLLDDLAVGLALAVKGPDDPKTGVELAEDGAQLGEMNGLLTLSWWPDSASPLAVPSHKPQKLLLLRPGGGARVNQERKSAWKQQNMETARSSDFEQTGNRNREGQGGLQTAATTDRRRREGHRQSCPRASLSGHWNRVRRGVAYRRAGGAEPTRVRAGRHRSLGKPFGPAPETDGAAEESTGHGTTTMRGVNYFRPAPRSRVRAAPVPAGGVPARHGCSNTVASTTRMRLNGLT
jgi:hypothetical protein